MHQRIPSWFRPAVLTAVVYCCGAARLILGQTRESFPSPNEYRARTIVSRTAHVDCSKDTALDARFNWSTEPGRLNLIQTPSRNTGEGVSAQLARHFGNVHEIFRP